MPALLRASEGSRIRAYIALLLGTGIRTEEARALCWEHVDFGDAHAILPRSASVAVWRSVRAHGDTKTPGFRRTLGLPAFAGQALADLQHATAASSARPTSAASVGQPSRPQESKAPGRPASCGTPSSA
jgi:integrase